MPQLDKKTIEALKRGGMLSQKFSDYMTIGKVFRMEYRKTGSKMQAYMNTSVICHKSDETVRKAVAAVRRLENE